MRFCTLRTRVPPSSAANIPQKFPVQNDHGLAHSQPRIVTGSKTPTRLSVGPSGVAVAQPSNIRPETPNRPGSAPPDYDLGGPGRLKGGRLTS